MTTTQSTQAQWDAANRFLDQLFIDPILANGYQQISQQANGQDNAPEILTTWLQQQGYDTTPELVYSALIALQNTSLTYWSGVYGQSFFDGSQPAPVLVIGPNTENNTVPYLDGVELKNYAFESVKTKDGFHPVLCWNLDSNETAGNITFYYTPAVTSGSTLPTGYTGNWFQGTLQTSANSLVQNYHGGIGESTDKNALSKLNLGVSEDVQSFWDKYSTYVYVAIAAVGSIVIISVLVYRNRRIDDANFERFEEEQQIEPVTKKVDEWIVDFANPSFLTEQSLKNAKDHFGDQFITQEQLLRFINQDEFDQLLKRRYLGENLVKKVSDATEINANTVSSLLTQGLSSDQAWKDLMEQGFTKEYFDNPQIDNPDYQTWLQAVKDKLKETSVQKQPEIIQPPSDLKPIETQPKKNYQYTFEKQKPLTQEQKDKRKDEVFQYIEKFGDELKPYYVGEMDGLTPNSQEYNDKLAKIKEDLKSKSKGYIEEHGSYPPFGKNVLYPSKEYRQKVIDKTAISDEAQRKQVSEDLDTIFQELKVDLERRQEYLKNIDILVKKAKSENSNMTREQAETWLLNQGLVFNLENPSDEQLFLENFKPEKSDRPEEKKTQFEKPDSKTTSKPGDKTKIDPSKQKVIADNENGKQLIDKTIKVDSLDSKDSKKEDPKKSKDPKEVDSKPHEVRVHEGFK